MALLYVNQGVAVSFISITCETVAHKKCVEGDFLIISVSQEHKSQVKFYKAKLQKDHFSTFYLGEEFELA